MHKFTYFSEVIVSILPGRRLDHPVILTPSYSALETNVRPSQRDKKPSGQVSSYMPSLHPHTTQVCSVPSVGYRSSPDWKYLLVVLHNEAIFILRHQKYINRSLKMLTPVWDWSHIISISQRSQYKSATKYKTTSKYSRGICSALLLREQSMIVSERRVGLDDL